MLLVPKKKTLTIILINFLNAPLLVKKIEYLGHVVFDEGVQPLSDKVQAIQQWPQPRTARALCGFLGLAGFY